MYNNQLIPPLAWQQITTVLLDMDGTLLDKYYDDYFWERYLPEVYGRQNSIDEQQAQQELYRRYRSVEQTLKWTDLNYWSDELGLDIIGLKKEVAHLINVNPHAVDFLQFLQHQKKAVYLVTAAHPAALEIKMNRVDLRGYFEQMICAEELGRAKEETTFWENLEERLGFEPERTLFADDNVNVLRAAREHGINHLIHIAKPSSRQPPRHCEEFISVAAFDELLAPCTDSVSAEKN